MGIIQFHMTSVTDKLVDGLRMPLCLAIAIASSIPLSVQAQTTDVNVSTEVLSSFRVESSTDLHFGNFIPGTSVTRFRINPNNGVLNRVAGNATSIGGGQTAAVLKVTGTPFERVRFTRESGPVDIVHENGTSTLRVNRFRLDGRRNRRLDENGEVEYRLGGQIRIRPDDLPGSYSGTFNITLDYL